MNNDGKTPEIRFRGFDGEWETRLLNEIVSISKGTQLGKKFLLETGAYYVLNGGITPSGYTNSYNTEANTISISEGGNSCGFVFFNREKFWSGGHNYTLSELTTDTCYLYHYLKFQEPKIMGLRVGSGLPNVQKSRLEQVVVSFPALEEQRQIGSFFERLDALIAHYRRRRDKLSSVKKSLLEKMFPRDGAKVPEIRFEGFDGEWEIRRLGDITTSYSGGTPVVSNKEYYSGNIPFIRSGEISANCTELFLTELGLNSSSAAMVEKGDILYALYGAPAEKFLVRR